MLIRFRAQNIKEGISGHPASWYSDVFDLIFPNIKQDAANSIWDKELKEEKKSRRKEKDEDDD